MTLYCQLCDEPTERYHRTGKMRCRRCALLSDDPIVRQRLIEAKQARDELWLNNYWWGCPIFTGAAPEWPSGDERWRPIENLRGQYDVSDQGRVRSWWYNRGGDYYRRVIPRLVVSSPNEAGYRTVSLVDWHTGIKDTYNIHVLVTAAFRGPRPDGYVSGHTDGRPANNHLSNLGWITYKENEADKHRHGTAMVGSRNVGAKLTEPLVIAMRMDREFGATLSALAAKYGVRKTVVSKICRWEAWRHV